MRLILRTVVVGVFLLSLFCPLPMAFGEARNEIRVSVSGLTNSSSSLFVNIQDNPQIQLQVSLRVNSPGKPIGIVIGQIELPFVDKTTFIQSEKSPGLWRWLKAPTPEGSVWSFALEFTPPIDIYDGDIPIFQVFIADPQPSIGKIYLREVHFFSGGEDTDISSLMTIPYSFFETGSFRDFPNTPQIWGTAEVYSLTTTTPTPVVTGFPDSTFRPQEVLKRAEIAKMAVTAFNIPLSPTIQSNLPFSDVAAHWAAIYITSAATAQPPLVKGYPDGSFQPDKAITKAELVKMLVCQKGWDKETPTATRSPTIPLPDVKDDFWAAPYIFAATSARHNLFLPDTGTLLDPSGNFNPNQAVSRVEACVLLKRALDLPDAIPPPPVPTTTIPSPTATPTSLPAPSDLTGVHRGDHIKLTWDVPSILRNMQVQPEYEIYRKEEGQGGYDNKYLVKIPGISGKATMEHLDGSIDSTKTYLYKIRISALGIFSDFSKEIRVAPPK